jgi:erythronate-4-phosphate dehydrogenase
MKIVADANIPFVKECFSSIGEVEVVAGRQIKPKEVIDADVLLVRSVTPVNEKLLAGSKVKFVATATIGVEHIDCEYLQKCGIGFASAPGSNANSVAEYIVAALLETGQKHNITLEGKSIGVVGVGNVGSKVVKKCGAMGMKIYFNDPPLQRQTGEAKYLPIEKLFDCDFITLHTPLTFDGIDKTYHLADEKFFKSLKTGCVFLNTSRGGVVETGALKAAIKSGEIKAAVLDVWENEPNIDTELLEMADIGTPHIAGYSFDGKVAGMIMIYKAACKHFGLEPRFNIDSFLPEPIVPEIKIKSGSGGEENILREVVRKVYDIKADDRRLQGILNMGADKRGAEFDRLRKDYPVRREFQNTKVILATENTENIKEKLKGIGFKEIKGEK